VTVRSPEQPPDASTPWARFLCSSRHFSPADDRVRFSAFMPKDRATSVFHILGLGDDLAGQLGHDVVAGDRSLYGHAEVTRAQVDECGLSIDADNIPPRHGNIVGWPEEKAEQRLFAQDLAEAASLHLYDGHQTT